MAEYDGLNDKDDLGNLTMDYLLKGKSTWLLHLDVYVYPGRTCYRVHNVTHKKVGSNWVEATAKDYGVLIFDLRNIKEEHELKEACHHYSRALEPLYIKHVAQMLGKEFSKHAYRTIRAKLLRYLAEMDPTYKGSCDDLQAEVMHGVRKEAERYEKRKALERLQRNNAREKKKEYAGWRRRR